MNIHRPFLLQYLMKKLFVLLFIYGVTASTLVKADASTGDFNNVVKTYLDVKNALVSGNATTAKTAAANMLTAINAVTDKSIDAAQYKTWLNYADKLSFDARHISESDDINHQREHFASLSTNILDVLKVLKSNTFTLYKQYCPMKKKYWLSETAAVKNPYYGSKMMTCGETKETLAAVK